MTDGIIKGSGNSRYLRSVANARTLYPTYSDFLTALIQGTFPIDLNGINSSGWSTVGTKLNKASLLTDSLCSALGLSTSATPNQAMDKLRQLVNTAQSTANSAGYVQTVSRVGNGTSGANNPCSITFAHAPQFILFDLYRTISTGASVQGHLQIVTTSTLSSSEYKQNLGFTIANSSAYSVPWGKKSSNGRTFSWYITAKYEDVNGTMQLNNPDYEYFFVGVG